MRIFKFIMEYNGKVVASGVASATMVYQLQKAFWDMASYAPSSPTDKLVGKFASLDNFLSRKVGENEVWTVTRPEETSKFEAVRTH